MCLVFFLCRLDSGNNVRDKNHAKLMDVFQEPNFAVLASNLEQINKADENGKDMCMLLC